MIENSIILSKSPTQRISGIEHILTPVSTESFAFQSSAFHNFYVVRSKCCRMIDEPRMHRFLQFLFSGYSEIHLSQSWDLSQFWIISNTNWTNLYTIFIWINWCSLENESIWLYFIKYSWVDVMIIISSLKSLWGPFPKFSVGFQTLIWCERKAKHPQLTLQQRLEAAIYEVVWVTDLKTCSTYLTRH